MEIREIPSKRHPSMGMWHPKNRTNIPITQETLVPTLCLGMHSPELCSEESIKQPNSKKLNPNAFTNSSTLSVEIRIPKQSVGTSNFKPIGALHHE
jgi:hypothetical protein